MKTRFIAFLLLFVMNLGVFAQSSYQPTEENLKARQEFQDNKFGIFPKQNRLVLKNKNRISFFIYVNVKVI